MLRIDRAAVDRLGRATTVDEVLPLVVDAMRLEFATIPPYLTAMLSLRPGANRDIWWAVHDVVVDEMLHLLIAANLLNALGGRPDLLGPRFVPTYPDGLPLGIGDHLEVGLEAFSLELVERVFMEIEEPEDPLVFRGPAGAQLVDDVEFSTIGEFYRALGQAVRDLPGDPFVGSPERQVVAPRWFPDSRLFPIDGVAAAVTALDLVAAEGEGSTTSPIDPDGDVAHYYRFAGIVRGRRLVADPDAAEGFSFTGDPYDFDAAGVWPITPNQRHEDLEPGSEAWRAVARFRTAFTRLLRALQRTLDGGPGHLDAAMGLMFELKLVGQRLVSVPVRRGGVAVGPHAGPVFRLAPGA